MARILVIEDEEALSLLLQYNLEAAEFEVTLCDDGDEADYLLQEDLPDLVILDWMLPNVSGIELCRRIRAREISRTLPIIMLTARGEEEERIRGLQTGADDYMVKPFSVPELLARVSGLLRRSSPELMSDSLSTGDLILDRSKHRVHRNEEELKLGPTEYRLLEFFMMSPGRVFDRQHLLDKVWGMDAEVTERTVDVHVGRLRRIVNLPGCPDLIRTVRGAGYGLDDSTV